LLFDAQCIVDELLMVVGELVKLLFGSSGYVLGDIAVFSELIDLMASAAAVVPNRHSTLFSHLLYQPDQFTTAFLSERREREPHHSSVIAWIEPQIGLGERLEAGMVLFLADGDHREVVQVTGGDPVVLSARP